MTLTLKLLEALVDVTDQTVLPNQDNQEQQFPDGEAWAVSWLRHLSLAANGKHAVND